MCIIFTIYMCSFFDDSKVFMIFQWNHTITKQILTINYLNVSQILDYKYKHTFYINYWRKKIRNSTFFSSSFFQCCWYWWALIRLCWNDDPLGFAAKSINSTRHFRILKKEIKINKVLYNISLPSRISVIICAEKYDYLVQRLTDIREWHWQSILLS